MNTISNSEVKEYPEGFEYYKKSTQIVKFSPNGIKNDYNNWFMENEKVFDIKIPTPVVNKENIIYSDYGKFEDDKEKIDLDRKEVDDIFKRDGNNYVKDDIIMNILRKMNKNK